MALGSPNRSALELQVEMLPDEKPAGNLPAPSSAAPALRRRRPAFGLTVRLLRPQTGSHHLCQHPGTPRASPALPPAMLAVLRPQAARPVSGRCPIVLLSSVQAGCSRQQAGPSPSPSPPAPLARPARAPRLARVAAAGPRSGDGAGEQAPQLRRPPPPPAEQVRLRRAAVVQPQLGGY